jgi:hypothetical protein
MSKLIIVVFLLAVLTPALCIDPPVYNISYHITFDDTFIVNNTKYQVNGQ